MILAPVTIAIHSFGRVSLDGLISDVRAGLTRFPKELPPRWFYDERGSELFETITLLPEYYQTRTEARILQEAAADVIAAVRPEAIVELGSGSSAKARILIEAGMRDRLTCFVPFDISESMLQQTARQLATDFAGLSVYAMVGDFSEHLSRVPRYGRQLVMFLGSTIGNFDDGVRHEFLRQVRCLLEPGDAFLLGIDLLKDEDELVAAYDDAQGVTADFNRNVLAVLNRELGADFDLEQFEHVARFNAERSRMEMHLRARRRFVTRIPGAGLTVEFAEGEEMMTEISVKFSRTSIACALEEVGLRLARWYSDPARRFAVCLCVPAGPAS
jgi:L-histidine N-alpha-methyltransferase